MAKNLTCLVTIHGIGFEQPPLGNKPNSGYADLLHQHLKEELDESLSDDPMRQRDGMPGENGAIYVESRSVKDDRVTIENGLERLGRWTADRKAVDITNAPLVAEDEPIAHIALVYSNLEPDRGSEEAGSIAFKMSFLSRKRYGGFWKLLCQTLSDTWIMLRYGGKADKGPVSTRPRHDFSTRSFRFLRRLRSSIQNLQDDVACYVSVNDERERVRSFVAEALTRLAYRDDVKNIILNTHSNGTVVGFDVIRHLPPKVTDKIKAFVTAGCPLRKYVDLLSWGNEVQTGYPLEPWYNFLDEHDIVADPLEPSVEWRVGEKKKQIACDGRQVASDGSLFCRVDYNKTTPALVHIDDLPVDNVKWSKGGGLRAHNYWDNTREFIPQLTAIIRATVGGRRVKIVGKGRRKRIYC